MRKGEGWRALKWVGTHGLAVCLTMRPFPHGQAQTQTFDSLQVGATWWWGDLDQWTLAEEDALWTLDATSEGPHVLCGCQPDVSEPGMVALHWHQGVHGSGANRSQLFFGSSDSDNASETARQWGLTALGDSLTMGVRLSAGESGSSDALRVECPGAPPLAPFEAYGPTTAVFQWDAHQEGDQVTAVRYGVMDPLLGVVVFQDET